MPTVQEAGLPAEARRTLDLVDGGGPFPYEQDGSVFGDFEGLLPRQERGHHHEYTVETPGSDDRGARRIVTGRDGETYCTDDRYASFTAVLRGHTNSAAGSWSRSASTASPTRPA